MKLKDNKTGKEAIYQTEFNITVTESHLLISFIAQHSTFNSFSNKYNDTIYKGDVCEIFLATTKDKKHYYEIEVAPNNTVFLAEIFNNNGSLECSFIKDNFLSTSVDKNKNSYKVNISIPLNKLKYSSINDFYFNAFRIETDGEKPEKYLFALNPTLCGSFHKPEFFVKLSLFK